MLAVRRPQAWISAVASASRHLEVLAGAAARRQVRAKVMVDLDAGMHRTGIAFGERAEELYRAIAENSHLEAVGLHVYDGHEHIVDEPARAAAATPRL